MQIVVDAGGTSCTWILIDNGMQLSTVVTDAIHAILTPDSEITDIAQKALVAFNNPSANQIHFYGAGCIGSHINDRITQLLHNVFNPEHISVNTDMLCAARALFGDRSGIACILGTGSNSCHYNGTEIIENVSPLGFILGDEGSGAVLGRTLLGDILKKQLPADICQRFWDKYSLTQNQIIEHVYRKQAPNRFLASFTPFLKENIYFPEIETLVVNAFTGFLKRNIINYENAYQLPVSFIGSIAWHFSSQLKKAMGICNLNLETIEQTPVTGITAFHLKRPSVSL